MDLKPGMRVFDLDCGKAISSIFQEKEFVLQVWAAGLWIKPGAALGIAVPGMLQEFSSGLPEPLKPYWEWDFTFFHSPAWWGRQCEKTGIMNFELADSIPNGWKHWLKWQEVKLH